METSLLQRIYDVGQEMAAALDVDDLERYFELVDKRGMLLEELGQYGHASEVDPNWMTTGDLLAQQYQRLMASLVEREKKMQDELTGMHRYKGASRSYRRSETRPQILNENLRV